ncbi:Hypothetical protein D9617_5g067590 [Elsinoe fawcettii]|nr:Hypothetical protein D9617_5g067590 [Elsinoe fawcettii]
MATTSIGSIAAQYGSVPGDESARPTTIPEMLDYTTADDSLTFSLPVNSFGFDLHTLDGISWDFSAIPGNPMADPMYLERTDHLSSTMTELGVISDGAYPTHMSMIPTNEFPDVTAEDLCPPFSTDDLIILEAEIAGLLKEFPVHALSLPGLQP